jgi:hypothetical protein
VRIIARKFIFLFLVSFTLKTVAVLLIQCLTQFLKAIICFYYIRPCLQQKMFACVNVNLYFSLFGLFCGRADSRILS